MKSNFLKTYFRATSTPQSQANWGQLYESPRETHSTDTYLKLKKLLAELKTFKISTKGSWMLEA